MDNDVVIITACDQHYFPLCVDLLASIKSVCGILPRIRVLDVGLLPDQVATLAAAVEKVITPDWDVGQDMNLPAWYRAMTARPFLPKYAGDAALIAWIDCDAWVQRFTPVQSLIDAARDGRLAIVEERFGKGFSVNVPAGNGSFMTVVCDPQSVKANIRSCYEACFGADIAADYGDLPCFNVGVFALRADSPSWKVWQSLYAPALTRQFNFLAEQQALNVGIRQGLVPISKQPPEVNYVCHLELPWYSADQRVFTVPDAEDRVLGVIHLCNAKDFPLLPIPQFPHGQARPMPLDYRSVRPFLANKAVDAKIPPSRNAACPCGSGEKYKHCHGQLAF